MADDIKGKPVGITRRIDNLGRIVIPMEYRREYNISPDSLIEIFLYENGIFMQPFKQEQLQGTPASV
ncbi:MAG: AbrB/MazE/SpoVT family DNA-binding domain-containing protein [Clostridiales bacterium]|nr:AbrB/MazE/SpoVT family DNA-binding domain-containing protein [Clostridiales bacterium]